MTLHRSLSSILAIGCGVFALALALPAQEDDTPSLDLSQDSPTEDSAPVDSAGEGDDESGALRGIFNFIADKGSKALRLDDEAEEGDAPENEAESKVNELMQQATLSIGKGRVTEAMRHVNELIALKPYDPDVHFALGLCFRRLSRFNDAQKKYQDVLDLGGPKSLISLLTAESYAMADDKENALKQLKEAAVGGRNIINDVGLLPSLKKYRDDTEFIKLALQLEKFELTGARANDPFTNPFPQSRAADDIGPKTTGPVKVNYTPEEQEQLLKEAKKAYARVQFYVKLEDENKAMKSYHQLRELFSQREYITIPKIANDLRFLENRMEEIEVQIEGIRLKFYYNQAKDKLKLMKESFLDGEYSAVESVHEEIASLADEMTSTNAQYKPIADRVLETSEQWVRRARVRQEFQSRRPRIQGIVIGDDGKMAVLNDRVVKQGEAIQDFRVVKVESNRVTFRYKGEEIPLVFRRY